MPLNSVPPQVLLVLVNMPGLRPSLARPQTRDASRTLSASWNGPVFMPLQLGLQNKSAAPRPPGHIHSAPCDLRPPPGRGSRFLSELSVSASSSFAKLPECVYKSKKAALSPFSPGGSYWVKLQTLSVACQASPDVTAPSVSGFGPVASGSSLVGPF